MKRGFTLLELIIAMALSALVVLSAGMALRFAIDTWWKGYGAEEELVNLFRVMELLGRQLRHASGVHLPFRRQKGFFEAKEGDLIFLTNYAPSSFRGGPVIVRYSLKEEELLYQEIPYTSARTEEELRSLLSETETVKLLKGVKIDFSCRFPEMASGPFPSAVGASVRYRGKEYMFFMPVEVIP